MTRLSLLSWLQLSLVAALLIALAVQAKAQSTPSRIVAVGGSVTEIVFALGQQDRLVARDTTSNHPKAALDLPDVGYIRRLSPEGVLSVDPDLIIAEDGAGPPEALELLEESLVPVVTIPMGYDRDAVIAKIRAVADALDVSEQGAALAQQVATAIDTATAEQSGLKDKRVMFILSDQGGRIMAAGHDTAAQGIIQMAGAQNALTGFDGYKIVTDEAIIQSQADVILLMAERGRMAVDDETLLAYPAFQTTPAAKTGAVVRMDGMLMLGFSVRTGQAVADLTAALQELGG